MAAIMSSPRLLITGDADFKPNQSLSSLCAHEPASNNLTDQWGAGRVFWEGDTLSSPLDSETLVPCRQPGNAVGGFSITPLKLKNGSFAKVIKNITCTIKSRLHFFNATRSPGARSCMPLLITRDVSAQPPAPSSPATPLR